MLVKQLRRDDYVGIAVYGDRGRKVLGHTNDPEAILEALDMLTSDGSTNAEEGIRIGYEMAAENFRKGSINRVILCSDGVANVGATGPNAILKTIEANRRKGITLSAIGFGMSNYNDTLMEQLGNKGDGHYAYVDTLDEAKKIFVDNLTGTLQVIARDVKMQVEFNPAVVKSYRLIGYENRDVADKDFRNDKVDAGEVGSGHSVTAVYELILKDGARTSGGNVATVRLRAKAPGPDAPSKEYTTSLAASQMRSELPSASADTRLAFAAASFAERLRGSRYAGELSYDQILALARGAARPGVAEDKELIRLIERAKALTPADPAEVATQR